MIENQQSGENREMLADLDSFDDAMAGSEEETVPHEIVRRLVAGESPLLR